MSVTSLARPRAQTITAAGGTVYDIPVPERGLLMRVHKFTASGNFVVSAGAGLVEYLIQAGGGGGGGTSYRGGCGGGAGGLLLGTASVDSGTGTYAVVVGSGGSGGSAGNNQGSDGGNSSAFGVTATGGGGGEHGLNGVFGSGRDGGSGGGGNPSGQGVAGQGDTPFRSGIGTATGGFPAGGGLNYESDIDGTLRVYARAGSAGGYDDASSTKKTEALYGEGGCGAASLGSNAAGNNGGPGIVIIRYALRRAA